MFDGILGDIFDFNGDGQLDAFEQAAELGFIVDLMRDDEPEADGGDDFFNDFI